MDVEERKKNRSRTKPSYLLLHKSLKEIEKDRAKEAKNVKSRANLKNNNEEEPSASTVLNMSEKTSKSVSKKASASAATTSSSIDYNIPDRTLGDLYCRLCDAHMNSEQMFDAHIQGKRHIKNMKKGESESKYVDLDTKSELQDLFDNLPKTVIGLNSIFEIRRREPDLPPVYQCFLCNSNIATGQLVVEHVLGIKHKTACVKELRPEGYKLLQSCGIKKSQTDPLIENYAVEIEKEFGKGKIQVRKEKPKSDNYYKRSHRDDDYDGNHYKRSCRDDDYDDNHNKRSCRDDDDDDDGIHYKRSHRADDDSYYKRSHRDDDEDDYYKDVRRPPKSMKHDDRDRSKWGPLSVSDDSKERSPQRSKRHTERVIERDCDVYNSKELSYSHNAYQQNNLKPIKDKAVASFDRDMYDRRRAALPHSPEYPPKDTVPKLIRPLPPIEYEHGIIPKNESSSAVAQQSDQSIRTPAPAEAAPAPAPVTTAAEFVTQFLSLPPKIFYNLILYKLENQQFYSEEDLSSINQIHQKIFKILVQKKWNSVSPCNQAYFQHVLKESGLNQSELEQIFNARGSSRTCPAPQVYSSKSATSENAVSAADIISVFNKLTQPCDSTSNAAHPASTYSPSTTTCPTPAIPYSSSVVSYPNPSTTYSSHQMYPHIHPTRINEAISYPEASNLNHMSHGQAAYQSAHSSASQSYPLYSIAQPNNSIPGLDLATISENAVPQRSTWPPW